MLVNIITMILNAAFIAVLNMDIYTDRAMMPNGEIRQWQRSPVTRLNISGQSSLLYLQLAFAAVSVITSVLIMSGVNNSTVKKICLVSTAASAVMFVIIMVVTSITHVNYA